MCGGPPPSSTRVAALNSSTSGRRPLSHLSWSDPYLGCHNLSVEVIGALPMSLTVMEYVEGLGLYGLDKYSGYLISELTGKVTPLASLYPSSAPITGLAYDPDSGRLLGSSGNPYGQRKIYLVDPTSGAVTVLNDNAPNLHGIAAVLVTPEPRSAWLVVTGLEVWLAIKAKASNVRADG